MSFFDAFILSLSTQAQVTTTYKAEDLFAPIADVGTNGTIGWTETDTHYGVTLFDQGDKISIDFNIATAGDYQIFNTKPI